MNLILLGGDGGVCRRDETRRDVTRRAYIYIYIYMYVHIYMYIKPKSFYRPAERICCKLMEIMAQI